MNQKIDHNKEPDSIPNFYWSKNMGYVSSNMINLNGPLIQIFVSFLLAIIGCVLILSAPDHTNISYALFLIAFILLALAIITLYRE